MLATSPPYVSGLHRQNDPTRYSMPCISRKMSRQILSVNYGNGMSLNIFQRLYQHITVLTVMQYTIWRLN